MSLCLCGCGQKTRIATRTDKSKGWIKGKPLKYAHRRRLIIEWIVNQKNGCWIWQGHVSKTNGYGLSKMNGKTAPAHRVVFTRFNGTIDKNLSLDHLCRNRKCVNPEHLQPVTRAENSRRGIQTKLSKAQVSIIKKLRLNGESLKDIAHEFNVSFQTICDICKGRSWKEESDL